MEPFRDTDLSAELRALRPTPRPAFAAELDERAAAGFPRRAGGGASPLSRVAQRIRAFEPRRALVPAGATALAAIAAVTVVVAVGEDGVDPTPSPQADSAAREGSFLSETTAVPPESAASSGGAASTEMKAGPSSGGPYASQAPNREVERSAEIALVTEPAEVAKDAGRVFEAVHAHRGIVLSSSVSDGAEGEAGARFELLIPSPRLGDALAALSAIAEVRSRHEATADITAPTVRSGELLRDSRATIDGLLTQLSRADTDTERSATEAKLRAERRRSTFLRSRLSNLQRRANFSRVSLRIETGAAPVADSGDEGWGIGAALDDAGNILGIAAAVTVVALAIIAPIALLAGLAWLANHVRLRRARERALS